jgi:hypothetical protein
MGAAEARISNRSSDGTDKASVSVPFRREVAGTWDEGLARDR